MGLGHIKALFEPRSIAVVGASREPWKTGHIILKNIVEAGFKGKIYPINPKATEILGLTVYPSVSKVPDDIDMMVIVVPARIVPRIMEEAGEKGVKAAVIISGGFAETGPEGAKLQEEVVKIARKYGIRFVGPNCQGVNNPHNGLCASWPLIKKAGPLAIISQSGTVAATFEIWAEREGIGISKMVALGNRADITEVDILEYLGEDPNTKAIGMYIESVSHGKRFLEVAQEVTKRKPIIVLKSGRTAAGARAVASHTGSLAGEYRIYLAAFKKAGVIPVDSIEELYDVTKGLALLPKPKGNRVLIITSSGGSGIISTDYSELLGLKVTSLASETAEELRKVLPSYCIVRNPLDLTGDATAERYSVTLERVIKDPNVDIVLTIFGDPIPNANNVVEKYYNKGKTIVPVYLGGGDVEEKEKALMHSKGIPVFPTPERGVKVVRALYEYTLHIEKVRRRSLS